MAQYDGCINLNAYADLQLIILQKRMSARVRKHSISRHLKPLHRFKHHEF